MSTRLSGDSCYSVCRIEGGKVGGTTMVTALVSLGGETRRFEIPVSNSVAPKEDGDYEDWRTPPEESFRQYVGGVWIWMNYVGKGSYEVKEGERTLCKGTVDKEYFIGQTEVTRGLWHAVMGTDPRDEWYTSSYYNACYTEEAPVSNVNYTDLNDFIAKLNQMTGRHYRLPSKEEWQFAASGGNKTHGYVYAGSNDPKKVAVFSENNRRYSDLYTFSFGCFLDVGKKAPNELGLYDMSGNVSEMISSIDYSNYHVGPSSNIPEDANHFKPYYKWLGGDFASTREMLKLGYEDKKPTQSSSTGKGFRLALSKEIYDGK